MTLPGAFFVVLALFCFLWRPAYLLPLLLIASLFEVASVVNGKIGNFEFGLSPFYLVGVLIAARFAISIMSTGKFLPVGPMRGVAVALVSFWAWSFVSAMVMPRIFSGMEVYVPREGLDYNGLGPLRWTMSNLAQTLYLTLNVSAVLYALQTSDSADRAVRLWKALRWATFVVVGAGLLQRVAPSVYPYWLFNNNLVYYQGFDQDIDGLRRTTATFGEPSSAGSFLAAIGSGLVASYLSGRRGLQPLAAILLVLVALLSTTATTGYAGFAVMVFVLLVYFNPLKKASRASVATGWGVILVVFCIGATVLVVNPGLFQAASAMTVEKMEGDSFAQRVFADIYALILFKGTWGLGVGLGSNRPSSLVTALLSTIGAIGTGLFAITLYRLCKLFPGRSAPSAVQVTFWALLGLLVADAIGVPDLNRPALWGLFVVVVAQLNVYPNNRAMIAHGQRSIAPKVRISPEGTAGIVPAS